MSREYGGAFAEQYFSLIEEIHQAAHEVIGKTPDTSPGCLWRAR